MTTNAKIEVYEDEAGEYRWRLRLGNSKKFAVSGESFASKSSAKRAANRMAELVAAGGATVLINT